MFRHEQLHDVWIDSCAAYLKSIFGRRLNGATVVDYGFGRGNWSVAFARAGARTVYAVDAAVDNVRRFRAYVSRQRLSRIEVVEGNVLEALPKLTGDILWIYGILPVIPERHEFLRRMRQMARREDSLALVYHHDAGSLREFVVDAGRSLLRFDSERALAEDGLSFTRPARMRARDDLAAPVLNFIDSARLTVMLSDCGFRVLCSVPSFARFLEGTDGEEFQPHHLLCDFQARRSGRIIESEKHYVEERRVLEGLFEALRRTPLSSAERRNLAVGLFNAHFSFLDGRGRARRSVEEMFLLLMYALRTKGVATSALSPELQPYAVLFEAALTGRPRQERQALGRRLRARALARFLARSTVRV